MAGGGTGGHIIPALAVARELQRRGHDPVFIGTYHGMESKLVPAAGFPIEWIEINSGEIRKAWEENGGPHGRLGYPISDEKDIPGGKQSDFTGGTITWVDGTITVTPKS